MPLRLRRRARVRLLTVSSQESGVTDQASRITAPPRIPVLNPRPFCQHNSRHETSHRNCHIEQRFRLPLPARPERGEGNATQSAPPLLQRTDLTYPRKHSGPSVSIRVHPWLIDCPAPCPTPRHPCLPSRHPPSTLNLKIINFTSSITADASPRPTNY